MLNTLEEDAQRVKEELRGALSVLYFFHICSWFRVPNDKSVVHHLQHVKTEITNSSKIASNNIFGDNPERVIFIFSLHELTDEEKNVLCKGLNFSVKSGLIE